MTWLIRSCLEVIVLLLYSGRLALGVGDNMIRLWNLNAPPDMFDIVSLWQGIRGKVTAVSKVSYVCSMP